MAELATYRGCEPVTIKAGASALARGVRVTRQSNGTCIVQDATAGGDYVTLAAIPAATYGPAQPMGKGGKLPVLASEAVVVGDAAYSAAAGKGSKTATDAVVIGRWTQAASGDGVLGEVELKSVL